MRKPINVSPHRLHQYFCLNTIKFREIGRKHHPLASQYNNL